MDLHERWSDLAFAVLMATATVLTAWCAYQATRWGGVQAIRAGEANASRSESLRQSNYGAQLMAIDVGLWVQYVSALSEKNDQMASFLAARFPPELKAANNAWLDTQPLSNPGAPPSPFAMPEYSLPSLEEAQRLSDIATQKIDEAKDANEHSNKYVLLTVINASVLFLAGIGSKFQSPRIRTGAIIAGAVVLLATIVVLLTYPVY